MLEKSNVHYCFHNKPQIVSLLNQTNPAYTLSLSLESWF